MADTSPKDFSTTAASNATVGGINIAEGSQAAQLNDAIRAVLAVIKTADWGSGGILADVIAESTAAAGVTIDGLLVKDGDIPTVPATITAAITAAVPVGTPLPTFSTSPSTGYLMMNGDTLGSAASVATQKSDDYEGLFTYLWNSISDTYAAVSSGRGASAAADWAANKTITIPNPEDRSFFGAGGTYAAGETFGAATVTLTAAQMPSHTHNLSIPNTSYSNNVASTVVRATGTATNSSIQTVSGSGIIATAGSGQAHDNVPPGMGVYWQIKY